MYERQSLLNTLLELGHATSQNLGFAHAPDVFISYGEETITETNLLEMRRRHPSIIRLETFSKKKEATQGADWEWHIIGRRRTLRMRVQAKRLQRNDKLKIPHKVASSRQQQIDLLIADAKKHHMLPVYCIYSSEHQRGHWKTGSPTAGFSVFEAGCLLASAHKVKSIMPTSLAAIEKFSVPWHYLVDQRRYEQLKLLKVTGEDDNVMRFASATLEFPSIWARGGRSGIVSDFPTIDELNGDGDLAREYDGVVATRDELVRPSVETFLERRISKLVEIDVREIPRRRPPDGEA